MLTFVSVLILLFSFSFMMIFLIMVLLSFYVRRMIVVPLLSNSKGPPPVPPHPPLFFPATIEQGEKEENRPVLVFLTEGRPFVIVDINVIGPSPSASGHQYALAGGICCWCCCVCFASCSVQYYWLTPYTALSHVRMDTLSSEWVLGVIKNRHTQSPCLTSQSIVEFRVNQKKVSIHVLTKNKSCAIGK